MTATATLAGLSEDAARTLAAQVAEHPLLNSLAVDVNETGPQRWAVAVYFEGAPKDTAIAALAALAGQAPVVAVLPETDWVAKSLAGLGPVPAGPFVVHGGHDRGRANPNEIAIEIEANEAFGSGHHATTAGCLIAIERTLKRRRIGNALDLGTGSGVLAIALAKRARCPVVASDIDPKAARIAGENAQLNGVAAKVRAVAAAGFTHAAIRGGAPYDLIVANILAGPLVDLAPALRRHVAPGGSVILSGLLTNQQREVSATYRATGLRRAGGLVIDGWATLMFAAPGAPR